MESSQPLRLAVVTASLGRPGELTELQDALAAQTTPPALWVLSLESMQDAPESLTPGAEVILGSRGLCAQRNRGIEAVKRRADIVVFFDDDFIPSRYALEGIAALFAFNPDVVGATGHVLADGITRGGLTIEVAKQILSAYDAEPQPSAMSARDVHTAYGCNMAFRLSALVDDLRFDERLPLYGWQEDVDFAGRVRECGRMVATNAFAGVHRGVTRGRMPGRRLGFSQIVNPVYLVRKGSMRWSHAAWLMLRNLGANHLRMIAPEPHIDRRGRAIGNWLGLAHILRGRADPGVVLSV